MSTISRDLFFKLFGSGAFPGAASYYTPARDMEPIIAFSRAFHPKTVIEIGIQRGGTAKCLLDNSPWIQKYIGIDVTQNYHTSLAVQRNEVPSIPGELVRNDSRVELIVKPNGSRDLTAKDLPSADFIFIDGDHSFEGVLWDTRLARSVIRQGGIICWHDYGNPSVPSVSKAIDSLNRMEGDLICLIQNGTLCFQICREGRG